jgi:RNA recognition motif-containing protein
MKSLGASEELLTELAKESKNLIMSADGKKVKRSVPMPEKDTINDRSVYVRGFPLEDAVTIEAVQKIFTSFGRVLSVRLRRDKDKTFKGKAYVEFEKEDEVTKAMGANDLVWTSGETKHPLEVISKPDYFKERKQKQKDKKSELKRARDDEKDKVDPKDQRKEGLILLVTEVPKETDRDVIKDLFTKYGRVRYVDFYARDEQKAYVRFFETETTKAALDGVTKGEIKFGETLPKASILEGAEDEKYWAEKVRPFVNKPNRSHFGQNKKQRRD